MDRRSIIAALTIFLIALVFRLLFIADFRESPYFDHLMIDAASYDRWAQEIASGNFFGDRVFYQSPLYPYFLGGVYSIFGRDFLAARIVQALVGSLTCLSLLFLTRRLFGRAAGWIAGGLAAVYSTFIFQDAMLLKSVVLFLFLSLSLLRISQAIDSGRSAPLFQSGLLFGIAICGRGNLLFALPLFCLWLYVRVDGTPALRRLRAPLIFLTGAILAISPVTVRNRIVGNDWVLTESDAGINLYVGNNPHAIGIHQPPDEVRTVPEHEEIDARRIAELDLGRALKPSEVSRYWIDKAIDFALTHPLKELKLIGRKFQLAWNWYEVPDNYNQYYFARVSWLFRGLLPTFLFVAPLSLFGMVVTFRDWRRNGYMHLFVFAYLLSLLALYITSRYRLPILIGLIPFAAAGMVEAFRSFRSGRPVPLVRAVLILVSVTLFSRLDLFEAYGFSKQEMEVATFHAMDGRITEAEAAFERAVTEAANSGDLHLVHLNQGIFFRNIGRTDDAIRAFESALRAEPGFTPARTELLKLRGSSGEDH